jgi:hypothetical protein
MHDSFIRETPYWRLTVSHWPEAVKADVKPCLAPHGYPAGEEWLPNFHRPHDFDFRHPPTRSDFLQLARQVPWMSTYKDLLPILEENDWPMLDMAHKGASVDLLDADGNVCGELKVWRHFSYQNQQYYVPMITCTEWDRIVCRLKNPDEEALNMLRSRSENRIQERLMMAEDVSDERIRYEIRLVLHEAGHLKTKPKLPKKAA